MHANAKSIIILVEVNKKLNVLISEAGGVGFDPGPSKSKGNGLYNSHQRINAVKGEIKYEKLDNSMDIHIPVPMED